jgi:hypothetical protein
MALVVTHSGGPGPYTLHDPRLGLALSRARGVEASERGPRIVIISPEEGKVHSAPLDIDIRFEPQDGSPIDLSTLKVTYGKLVCIDLTSRVLPYASPEGIRVHQALFPAGTHTITIAIADRQGTLASRTLTIALR